MPQDGGYHLGEKGPSAKDSSQGGFYPCAISNQHCSIEGPKMGSAQHL